SFAKLGLGKTHLISHSIDVGETKAVKQRHYAVSPAVEKLLHGEVERMIKLVVIEESQSAWSSPVVLVQKPGKVRLCLDCRKVNGGVLVQKTEGDRGDEYPIAFISKKLSKAQKNYSVTEQECLAAIVCIKRFRPYVEEHKFTVITDHASLGWLMAQPDLRSRLGRWAAKLQAYRFHIEHRKGKLHVVPDALSRVHEGEVGEGVVASIGMDYASPFFETEEYKILRDTIEANGEAVPDLKVMEGKVFRRT
ncbi:hypothetical protein KR018_006899, partial [Drosophila ironensis]